MGFISLGWHCIDPIYSPIIRFKSLQKRNVIETRVKAKIVRNPKKRKRLEKRNYKMPWEKPRPLKA